MKTIRVHLHPVEEAMLIEVQKVNRRFRDIETLLLGQIREEYAKTPKGRSRGSLRGPTPKILTPPPPSPGPRWKPINITSTTTARRAPRSRWSPTPSSPGSAASGGFLPGCAAPAPSPPTRPPISTCRANKPAISPKPSATRKSSGCSRCRKPPIPSACATASFWKCSTPPASAAPK